MLVVGSVMNAQIMTRLNGNTVPIYVDLGESGISKGKPAFNKASCVSKANFEAGILESPEFRSEYPKWVQRNASKSQEFHDCFTQTSRKTELKKPVEENVFIDSYYPKFFGDCDGSKNSKIFDKDSSTCEDIPNKIEDQVLNNCLENESVGVYGDGNMVRNQYELSRGSQRYPPGEEKSLFSGLILKNKKRKPSIGTLGKEKIQVNLRDLEETPQQSSKSMLTIDSKTYTLYSCDSGQNPFFDKKKVQTINKNDEKSKKMRRNRLVLEEIVEPNNIKSSNKILKCGDKKGETLTTVECFAQLHKRIETLEELLQKTLANTIDPKKYKLKKNILNRQLKPKYSYKVCTPVRISPSKLWNVYQSQMNENTSAPETTPGQENSDTEHEIWSIKRRVGDLEKKLKEDFKDSVIIQSINPESSPLDNGSVLANCTTNLDKTYEVDDNMSDLKNQRYGEPVSFREDYFSRSKVLAFSKFDSENYALDSYSGKIMPDPESEEKHEVKNNFISKCKKLKRKCSSIMSAGRRSSLGKCQPIKVSDDCNDILYGHSVLTKKSLDRTIRCYSFPAQNNVEKPNEESLTKVIFVRRCQHKNGSDQAETKIRKRRNRKKDRFLKDLCKKNSKTNILSAKSKENEMESKKIEIASRSKEHRHSKIKSSKKFSSEGHKKLHRHGSRQKKRSYSNHKMRNYEHLSQLLADNYVNDKMLCSRRYEKESSRFDLEDQFNALKPSGGGNPENQVWSYNAGCWTHWPLWIPLPSRCCGCTPYHDYEFMQPKNVNSDYMIEDVRKTQKKPEADRSPLEILKEGGKIKIPVLFEELCGTKKTNETVHKASNISMRFVLVEEDNKKPVNPLRKLIKKLSRTQSSNRAEQYVFGVSKCCCDNKIQEYSSLSDRNVIKEFGYG